jgi:hypothetical protein
MNTSDKSISESKGLSIAKAFRTISNEKLCILAGTTHIIITTEQAVKLCNIKSERKQKKGFKDITLRDAL